MLVFAQHGWPLQKQGTYWINLLERLNKTDPELKL